jgi:hypothetical protein
MTQDNKRELLTNQNSKRPTVKTSASTLASEDWNVLQQIIGFIGPDQYRFVAGINHDFKSVYLQLFPNNKVTYFNAVTVEHAMISLECQHIRPADTILCNSAARHGSLSTLDWLHSNKFAWDSDICSCAAEGGHLVLLQWARTNGCPWDSNTCSSAAEYGHLEVLQWARGNGCPWDSETCELAAEGRRLILLQWARANGCPEDL